MTLLKLNNIQKAYPGCIANDDISLNIDEGEIHALLGENGAGKSTLVKIIYGVVKADQGSIVFQGKTVQIDTPAYARKLGIAMVFQHFSLFDSLTVTQNIALGLDSKVDLALLSKQIIDVSNRYGLPLDPQRHVYTLSVGERQRIEIIRCLLQTPKLLIMDEPTSVLTPQEVDKLFETLRRLSDEGMAILYISHKLDEIKALCQNATILRGGKCVANVAVASQSSASLAALMMGKSLQIADHQTTHDLGEARLQINNLSLPAKSTLGITLKNISFKVHSGEIVGLAGVAGNGQDEILKALNGEYLSEAGQIKINEHLIGHLRPNVRRKHGLVSVPERRLGHGAVPSMNLFENTFLTANTREKMSNNGVINHHKTRHFGQQVLDEYDVRTPSIKSTAGSLSGGNLQKFIVGRELKQSPSVVVVSQPTWGVDAGAAQRIRAALRKLSNEGAAVLVISQDLDELLEISDRIGAICAGRVSELFPVSNVNEQKMGLLMAGAT